MSTRSALTSSGYSTCEAGSYFGDLVHTEDVAGIRLRCIAGYSDADHLARTAYYKERVGPYVAASAPFYIEDVVQNQADAIRAIPDDEEVRQLDERIAQRAAARRREIAWRRVPLWLRLLLLSGSVVGLLAGWFVTLRGGAAFSEFEITMDPDTVLCLEGTPEQPKGWGEAVATPQNPNATGGLCTSPLVRPPGIAACACFLYVFVCLGVWRWWVAKRTREALERQAGGSSPRAAEAAAPDPDRVITTV